MTVTTPKYNPQVKKRDWAPVKAAFVEGYECDGVRLTEPQLGDVATKFGIPLSTVKKRSMIEKWTEERQLFQKRLEEAKREKTTEVLASKGAEFDALSLRNADKKLRMIERMIDRAEKIGDGFTPAQVRSLAGALKDAQAVGRLALGDSTENTKHSGALEVTNEDDARAEAIATRLAAKLAAGPA